MGSAATKEQAHALIDRMAPGQVAAVVGMLELLVDPVSQALANAPEDDEQVSEVEWEEMRAAGSERVRNEDVLAEFGVTATEFAAMGKTPVTGKGWQ